MRIFGLQPDQVLARASGDIRPAGTLGGAMFFGAASFCVVSVLAYSIWAYRLIEGEGALYAAVAAVFIGCSGVALSRLVLGPGATGRFALLFAVAFLVYAIAWCALWFGLKSKFHGDLWGSAAGLAAMTWLLQRAFGEHDDFLPAFAVLFTCHTLGYYLGDALHGALPGAPGRLCWGAAYGLGFGAGLGYVLFRCQAPLKMRLRSAP